MNVERMTQRVQEALNAAYTRALAEHNTQTAPESAVGINDSIAQINAHLAAGPQPATLGAA